MFSVVFGLGLGGEYLIIPLVAEATAPMLVGYLRGVRGNDDSAFLRLVAAPKVGTPPAISVEFAQ